MGDLYWSIRGPYSSVRKSASDMSKDDLESIVVNEHYNKFLRDKADYKDDEKQTRPGGKRVPYIGWFWRACDFYSRQIHIGDCGDFIGVMENNKWDYPERRLTDAEFDEFIAIVDAAIEEDRKGGNLAEIVANTHRELDKLWDFMAGLTIPPRND